MGLSARVPAPIRVGVAALLSMALAAVAVPSAAQAAPGDQATICGNTTTPAGWVDIAWYNSRACGAVSGLNTKNIRQYAGYGVGANVNNVCSTSATPAGWRNGPWGYNPSCGPSNGNVRYIQRIS